MGSFFLKRMNAQKLENSVQGSRRGLSDVQRTGFSHEAFGQVLTKTPVPLVVGVAQRRFRHRFAKAQMIDRFVTGVQIGGNIPQSLAPCQLGNCHADELLAANKMPDQRLGIVVLHQTEKHLAIYQIQNFRKYVATRINRPESGSESAQNSNAWHRFSSTSRSEIHFTTNL